jgi:hypothetical protein
VGGSTCSDCGDSIAVGPALRLDPPVRLDSRDAIDRALAERVYLRVFPPRLIVASSMSEDVTRSWQTRIDRLLDECGCGLGAAVALAAMGAYLASVFSSAASATVGGIILKSLGALFLGATVGKLVGVGRARLELRRVLLRLRESLA